MAALSLVRAPRTLSLSRHHTIPGALVLSSSCYILIFIMIISIINIDIL